MKLPSCDYEPQIVAALHTGSVPAALQSHLDGCLTCQDVALVTEFLCRAASPPSESAALPSASLIWWRAQLAEKRALADRSIAPIRLARTLALIALLLVAVFYSLQTGPEWYDKASPLLTTAVLSALLLLLLTAAVSYFGLRRRSWRTLSRRPHVSES